jgi:hypothetical protein
MDTQHQVKQHNSTEAVQTVSLYHFEESQKWSRSLTMQIPIIFDGRFKDSIANLSEAIKLMSKYFGGSRIWIEFRIAIVILLIFCCDVLAIRQVILN